MIHNFDQKYPHSSISCNTTIKTGVAISYEAPYVPEIRGGISDSEDERTDDQYGDHSDEHPDERPHKRRRVSENVNSGDDETSFFFTKRTAPLLSHLLPNLGASPHTWPTSQPHQDMLFQPHMRLEWKFSKNPNFRQPRWEVAFRVGTTLGGMPEDMGVEVTALGDDLGLQDDVREILGEDDGGKWLRRWLSRQSMRELQIIFRLTREARTYVWQDQCAKVHRSRLQEDVSQAAAVLPGGGGIGSTPRLTPEPAQGGC